MESNPNFEIVQGRIQDLIRGGPQIVTGLKLPFWGLSFVEFWCWGLIFGGQGGPGAPPWIRPCSIRHLYDNESITFLQLPVKAHRNEEEETTSKVVSKNVTVGHDSTLEQRVDNLIAKSNSNPASPNPTNGDNSHNYGHPFLQSSSRPKREYRQDSGHPLMDIQQNLRGPETSAAGPYRKADGSGPIQCFRCHGWGHQRGFVHPV